MIPMVLVTGFLGSGKTTYLRRLASRDRQKRLVFLVNEFSALDVDGHVLEAESDKVVSVVGGSIFCRCLVGQFLDELGSLPSRYNVPGAPLEGVVVEASGMADPLVVRRMLEETRLDRVYDLRTIVSVVDPGTLRKLLATLPNIRSQIAAAHVVLINKTDCFAEEEVSEAERAVREIHPEALIVRTSYCETSLDPFVPPAAPTAEGEGDYAPCRDPNFDTLAIRCPSPVDPAELERRLVEKAAFVYRAKGTVRTPSGSPLRVDYSGAGFQTEPAHESDCPGEIVLIVAGGTVDRVAGLAEWLGEVVASSAE